MVTEAIIAFASDWMGRQFCISLNSSEIIFVFDPATQEDFYLEENLLNFHNNILANDKVGFLALDLFEKGVDFLNIVGINYKDCLGFEKPLYLGGKEEETNYEVCDLEVYWDINYQMFNQISALPNGTRVNKVVINPFTSES